MTHRTLPDLVLARIDRGEDRGSIPLLMLIMVVTAMFGGILMTTVVNQSNQTRFGITRLHALHAAQAGIDVVLGSIRSSTASGSSSAGDDSQLPCGPWTGNPFGTSATTYTASIVYYDGTGTQMVCTTAAGPYSKVLNSRTPAYAIITSSGIEANGNGASQGRRLRTQYIFQTQDTNIPGGVIRLFPANDANGNPVSTQYCMDAGSSTPASGTAVTLQLCSTSNPPVDSQMWEYRSDLSIKLVSSSNSVAMCIDTSSSTHSAGIAMQLKPCAIASDSGVCPSGYTAATWKTAHYHNGAWDSGYAACAISPYNQQWSVDDNAHLEGATSDQTNIDGYCINAPSQSAGVALTLASCSGGTTDTAQTWVPSPTTGAGMAGNGNKQLVNDLLFATCLDVTGQNVNATYLILYTCKQNPDPTKVAFNQKFSTVNLTNYPNDVPTTTMIKVVSGSTTYCLKSPLTNTTTSYPVLSTPCPASDSAAAGTGFAWKVSQQYADTSQNLLPYADRFTIKDANGLCLGPGQNNDLLNSQYYKAIVTTCTGGAAQKWNALPGLDAATLTNTIEVPLVDTSGN